MSVRLVAFALCVAALPLGNPAQAQSWPQQPVKIVVGLAAGGLTDTITRIIAQPLTERFGQSFVVENRPGAAGTIAAEQVARATPDGYTLVMGNSPQMVMIPELSGTRYDPAKDFAPISIIGSNPFMLCVNAKVPVNSLAEFVAYVRERPGQLSYGSGGIGNGTHLSMAYFLKLAGLDMVHVPYKGGAPAMADVIAGHIPAMFASSSDALPQIRAGTIKVLAVSGSARAPQLPDVPTVRESGFPQFTTVTWNGLMAPAKTPKDIVEQMSREIGQAVKDPKVAERMQAQGIDPVGNTPEEFAATIASDIALWREAVRIAGAKSN